MIKKTKGAFNIKQCVERLKEYIEETKFEDAHIDWLANIETASEYAWSCADDIIDCKYLISCNKNTGGIRILVIQNGVVLTDEKQILKALA